MTAVALATGPRIHRVRGARLSSGSGEVMERRPDGLFDGRALHQISGPDALFDGWRHEFDVRHDEYDIFIYINSTTDTPQVERDATNASVLASVTLP